jgi:dolichol-phosphate mannosyltransferase
MDRDVRALVILPTYNEAEHVLPLSREIFAAAPGVEVVVVDDASPDGTGALVAQEALREPRLHLLPRPAKLGLGTAYLAGFRFGIERGFDALVTMDCDHSHRPRHLPALLDALRHCDMVIGSRYVPGGGIANWPWHRRALSRFANFYARALLRLPVRDCTSGFRGYTRAVIEGVGAFDIRSSGYSFLEEMTWRVHRCGYRIAEVPIVFEQRTAGVSKIDSWEIYRAAWHVLANAVRPGPRVAPRRSASGGDVGPGNAG